MGFKKLVLGNHYQEIGSRKQINQKLFLIDLSGILKLSILLLSNYRKLSSLKHACWNKMER